VAPNCAASCPPAFRRFPGPHVLFNDSTLDKELHGYAQRFMDKMRSVREQPHELTQSFRLWGDISSTSENEPGKGGRVRAG